MATLLFKFVFLSSSTVVLTSTELTGATAPTVNISSTAIADGTTIASVVSGGALVYDSYTKSWSYRLAGADLATYVYTGMATTTYATASPLSVHALGMVIPDALVSAAEAAPVAALNAAIPGSPTTDSINERIKALDDLTQASGGGDLAAIKGYVDDIGIAGAGLTALGDTRLANLDVAISTRGTSTYAGADTAGTTTLLGIFTGMTSLPKWLRGLFRKDAMDATAKSEINTGGGTFSETTESVEALRDRGDVAWLTGSIAGSGSETVVITCNDGTNPIESVAVWVTTDVAGTNVVAGTVYSNTSGIVTVYLDPGTYQVFKQGGANWTNPTQIVVVDV
jgi:hypothetical protein